MIVSKRGSTLYSIEDTGRLKHIEHNNTLTSIDTIMDQTIDFMITNYASQIDQVLV